MQAAPLTLVAASCANVGEVPQQAAWAQVQVERPDVLLLHGDNVYLANDQHTDPASLAAELRALYARQFAEPGFQALQRDMSTRGARTLAVYDDHDFVGNNRCGADHPLALREAARAAFVDAFGSAFSPQATAYPDEVYGLHRLGLVNLVLLDTRFHRRSAATSGHDANALLGQRQWDWLHATVAASTAPYLVLVSSSTLHAYTDQSWECWPAAFQRLRALLQGRRGALFLSGDAHRNAVYDESGVIEIVTSGVAQRSRLFGRLRQNYGVLRFDNEAVQVDLRSLKVGSRFGFSLRRDDWCLP